MIWTVTHATFCRLVLNSSRRFAYPFAPVLSRGLGVPLTAITSLIAINQATGILGIFFGPLSDRFGYRLMMSAGLFMLVTGMFAGGLLPFYGVVVAALFLAGLGKSVFDPALQAYVGKQVPYHRRGMVIGMLEFAWAGSTLVGIPLIGLCIARWGWRSPFFLLAGLGLLGLGTIGFLVPKENRRGGNQGRSPGFLKAWGTLLHHRPALGALLFGFFVSVANDNLFVVYGAWLEQSFQLSVIALGVGTSVIGMAEFLGEILTASLADRFGLKRSVLTGLLLSSLGYGILPLFRHSLFTALSGLFLVFIVFEFAIVAFLSLCTELLPGSRATMMSAYLAAAGAGRVLGAFIGGPVWVAGGIVLTCLVSAGISLLSVVSLAWGLRGWEET